MPKTPDKPKACQPLSLWPLKLDEALRIALTSGKPEQKAKRKKR